MHNSLIQGVYIDLFNIPYCRKTYTTDIHHRMEVLRSAAVADVQTIVAALIAVINPFAGSGERIQFYRVVDKYDFRNSERDLVAYKR